MAKETLNELEIVITDIETSPPNYLIDNEFGISGGYGDYSLVKRKIKTKTGTKEDGVNEGKTIQYIGWDTVSPHSYGRTIFDILNNYAEYINLKKFKQLNKCTNFDEVKQIYLDTQSTVRKAMKSTQFSSDVRTQATLIDEIAELKAKLKEVNDVLAEADELRDLIKSKRRIIIGETEPKKHRLKLEE